LARGYSRDIPPALRIFAVLLAACALGSPARAQQGEVQFLRSWQSTEPKAFAAMSGFALSGDGAALIADRERGVVWRVSAQAATAVPVGGPGRVFDDPKLGGVAALPDGGFAVASTRRDVVAIVDAQGKPAAVFAGSGSGAGTLDNPEGVTLSSQRRLYVADHGNNRVNVYSDTGVPLHAIGPGADGAPGLEKPVQVAVDGVERVYVLEGVGLGGRISVFDHGGKLLKRLSNETVRTGPNARWSAIAVDAPGRLFVADATSNNVSEIDWQAGQVRRRFGGPGSGRGQFQSVQRLALAGEELAVVDAGNRKIEFYRVPGAAEGARAARLPGVRRAASIAASCERAYAFRQGELLCLDAKAGKVLRLGADGQPKGAFAEGIERPRRVATDARDVAIVDGDRVKVLTLEGAPRFALGGRGSLDGEFDDIGGLHLSDYLYVADSGNRRVQVFTRDGILVHKLADAQGRVGRPVAVVTDSARKLYVADVEGLAVQVFSPAREWQYALGGEARGYRWIHALAIDADDRLYVLAATEGSRQVVDVYRGREHEFRFSAYRAPGVEASGKATLSRAIDGDDLVLHDAERGRIALYQYLQTPGQVAGLEVRGEPARARLRWRKAADRFVASYRVYGAAAPAGPWERVLDTKTPEATLDAAAAARYGAYRVGAVTGYGIEGEGSAPAEDLFRAGYREYEAGRHEAALPLFERAAKAAPDHAAPVEFLGRSQLALGRHAAALTQFRELGKRPGHEIAGRRLEAHALLAAGDRLGARAAAERAIAANQADAGTYALCAQLSLELNDAMGAVRCVEAALAKDPGNARSRAMLGEAQVRLGAVDKGLAELEAATAASPADAEPWRRSARVLQGLGRHREALARHARVLQINPEDADARLASAQLHLELGELDQARSIALSLAGSPAQEARGQVLLGRIALKLQKPEEALLALARATQLDPTYGDAWGGLAEAYLALRDEAKAAEALHKAARLPGAGVGVYRQLAELETRAGKHAAALAALERAVSMAPGDAGLRLAQARTLASLERWNECSIAAREAQRLAPKSVEALTLAAEAASRQGRHGEAIETLKRAVALAPDSYEVQLGLGRSYAENHLYEDAKTHLERAAQLNDRSDAPHRMLGQLQLEQRSYDAAIASFTAAAALNPSEANRRQLDVAYERKKRAQSGTGATLAIEDLRLNRVFVAAHKQYATEPLGQVKVRNASAEDFKNLKLSFYIKEYMDFPVTREVPELKAKSSLELPLHATFNGKVLGIDEDTRVLVVVGLAMADARDGAQEVTQAMTLYGKNAIVWARGDMVGSFVTPRDDTLRNFVREAANRYGPPPKGVLNRPLAQAASIFNTLAAHGLRYQPDPNTPYSRLSADQVDYVQFPRETLRLKSGDCDDLSVLLAAAFENLGIESALLETPGHLLLMFRTGLAERDRGLISLQDDLLALRGGEVWIPVESTLIATSFTEAWAEGAKRYRAAAAGGQLRVLSLRQAWERFPPATLAPVSWSVEVPAGERVARLIEREQRLLLGRRLEREVIAYRQALAANPRDLDARLQIGGIYARNGVFDVALREFEAILAQEPRHGAAINNRGNVFYARGEFEQALEAYQLAESIDPADGAVRLNAALAYYRLGKLNEARGKFREASKLDGGLAAQFGGFAKLLGN
jgi:tetratricopeptide (TPR) repeat protein